MQDESENGTIISVTPMQLVLIRNIHLRVSSHYQRVFYCPIPACQVHQERVLLWLGQMEMKVGAITAHDIKTFYRCLSVESFMMAGSQWGLIVSVRDVRVLLATYSIKTQQNFIMLCVSAQGETLKDNN